MAEPLPIVVLVSGAGSNLRAMHAAFERDPGHVTIAGVLSDRPDRGALAFAREHGIATDVVRPRAFSSRVEWDQALADACSALQPKLVVLAGFMRLVGAAMLERFPRRIINVHPSLLPAFPGADGPAQALRAGVRITGCTVHVVDAGLDSGPILAQAAVPLLERDDTASLHHRIQAAEYQLLPAVILAVAKIELELEPAPRWKVPAVGDSPQLFSPDLGSLR